MLMEDPTDENTPKDCALEKKETSRKSKVPAKESGFLDFIF